MFRPPRGRAAAISLRNALTNRAGIGAALDSRNDELQIFDLVVDTVDLVEDGIGLGRPGVAATSLTPTEASACFMTRLMPGDETFNSRAAPPTVPVTMIARITSIWRSVSINRSCSGFPIR